MKNFLKPFLLALIAMSLSFAGTAQKRTEIHKQESYNGIIFNAKIHYSGNDNGNWIFFIHGSGECGAKDGSQIDKVDRNGVLNLVANGYNVFAPQGPCNSTGQTDWSKIRNSLMLYLTDKLGAKKIVVTGLSQGGMETVDWGFRYKGTAVRALIVMCGQTSFSQDIPRATLYNSNNIPYLDIDWTKYLDVPYLGVHGTADTPPSGVSYYGGGLKVYNGVKSNLARVSTTEFYPIQNGGHSSAWTAGYNKTNTVAGKYVYALIDRVFAQDVVIPKPFTATAVVDTVKGTAVFTLPNGTLYKATISKQ